MESFYPNHTGSSYRYAIAALLLVIGAASSLRAQVAVPDLQPNAPITIDADSSEFDYETRQLVFKGLRMDQGDLGIKADLAETDKLDFTEGLWIFTGNVVVEASNTNLYCDTARITFRNHQLAEVELTGGPAHFEQRLEAETNINSGEANLIVYNLSDGTLQLSGDARFSDGSNEISGDLITYDLAARRLRAGSGDSGPVKILIEPPGQLKDKYQSP